MTPLKTTRAREIRETLIRAAEIALDPMQSGTYTSAYMAITRAARRSGGERAFIIAAYSYESTVNWSWYDRQRNCWALLLAAAAVED